jgi:tetratricopeptide (TPR) repeat protein
MNQILFAILLLQFLFFACSPDKQINDSTNSVEHDSIINSITKKISQSLDEAIIEAGAYLFHPKESPDSGFYYKLASEYAVMKAYIGESDSALFYLDQAVAFWKVQSGNKAAKNHLKTLYNKSFILSNIGKIDEAIVSLHLADSLSIISEDYSTRVHINMLLSSIHAAREEYNKALGNLERCIWLCEQAKDSILMISSLQTYADIFVSCHFFEEANKQFEKVEDYKDHFTNLSLFMHYCSKGRMFYLKGENEQAKNEFLNAYHSLKTSDIFDSLIISMNLAETYLAMKMPDSAKFYLSTVAGNTNYLDQLPLFNFNYHSLLGEYFLQKGNIGEASQAFQKADHVPVVDDLTLKKLHVRRKTEFNEKIGNYRQAYEDLKEYNKLQETMLETNNRMQIAGMQYQYERDTTVISQKNQLNLSRERIKKYQLRHGMLISIAGIVALAILFAYALSKKNKRIEQEKNMRKMASLKMENVRGRISPHFTFNVLNNIWAIIDDREKAREKFDNLMTMIRNSLVNSEKMTITLKEEIEFVSCFIDLQNLRNGEEIQVTWSIDEAIDLNHPVPGMILQIPVENAIKHGLMPKTGKKNLEIEISTCGKFLCLSIADNGIGYTPGRSLNQGTGTGLKVLHNTMLLLNQINKDKMEIAMLNLSETTGQGTQIQIRIPLNFNYNLLQTTI